MTQVLGFNFPTPDVTGLLSQSWIYIFIIVIIVIILGVILGLVLFFMTYNKYVEVYENIGGGTKMIRVLRTRARIVKVGPGGEELLHLLRPRIYRTAYGRKIAPNTYAFGVGPDGYWYNMTFGDLDTKMGILDVEPIDRDVRMMHVAVEKIIQENYNPNKTAQIVMGIFLFIMVIVLIIGAWIIIGKIGGISKDLGTTQKGYQDIATTQAQTTQMLINAGFRPVNINSPSGLVPAG